MKELMETSGTNSFFKLARLALLTLASTVAIAQSPGPASSEPPTPATSAPAPAPATQQAAQPAPTTQTSTPSATNAPPADTTKGVDAAAADEPITKIRTGTNEVNVVFTVTDKHGKRITDLKQSDFKILDDNKPPDVVRSFHA